MMYEGNTHEMCEMIFELQSSKQCMKDKHIYKILYDEGYSDGAGRSDGDGFPILEIV
jgi:hypothetical protein